MKRLLCVSAAVGAAWCPLTARAQDRAPRVAIVSAVTVNVTENEGLRVAKQLGVALTEKLVVDVIAGADANRRLPDGEVPEGCMASPDCIKGVARRLDADQVLFLAIVRLGDKFQIDPTWSDATAARTVSREAISIDSGAPWADAFADAAPRLLPDAERRAAFRPQQPPQPEPRPRPSIHLPSRAPKRSGRTITRGVWIAGGASAAALVGALSFSIAAQRTNSELEAGNCDSQPCDPALVDRLERRTFTADLFWGATAAAGITAGVLYFLSDRDGDGLAVDANANTVGASVLLRGTF